MQQASFVKACKDYFGFKPGQTMSEFMAELKALNAEDREYFKRHFKSVGFEIVDPQGINS